MDTPINQKSVIYNMHASVNFPAKRRHILLGTEFCVPSEVKSAVVGCKFLDCTRKHNVFLRMRNLLLFSVTIIMTLIKHLGHKIWVGFSPPSPPPPLPTHLIHAELKYEVHDNRNY